MEPDKFRESRRTINLMCKKLNILIEEKTLEGSREFYQEVYTKLDSLRPQAEGEIQERSVKNLSVKINGLLTHIDKLKPKKGLKTKNEPKDIIVWDEKQVRQLSPLFLKKVFMNMGDGKDSKVCFSATGKGIRPSYQIEFTNQDITAFSGSSHSPLKNPLSSGTKTISQPFSYDLVDSILLGK